MVDGGQETRWRHPGMREVVDRPQLLGVGLGNGANGRADEARGIGDYREAALQEPLLGFATHVGQAGGVHWEVRGEPANPTQGAAVPDVHTVADGAQDLCDGRPAGIKLQEGSPSIGTSLEQAPTSREFGRGEDRRRDGRVWPGWGTRPLEAEERAEALVRSRQVEQVAGGGGGQGRAWKRGGRSCQARHRQRRVGD